MSPELLDALPLDEREPRWREALSPGSPHRLWIAESDRAALGFASWGRATDGDALDGTASLDALYVQEAAGTGVALSLMRQVLREMRTERYAWTVLWVFEANERGRRFYERHGWVADGASRVVHQCRTDLGALRYALRVP